MNLLSNAVKFTPEGGEILVGAGTEETLAVLTVTDSGIGIPDGDQAKLFTRFFRASNAVYRSIPGTGLGLAIVRTIVDNHSGELAVLSREGKGTTVSVRFPLPPNGAAAGDTPVIGAAAGDTPVIGAAAGDTPVIVKTAQ